MKKREILLGEGLWWNPLLRRAKLLANNPSQLLMLVAQSLPEETAIALFLRDTLKSGIGFYRVAMRCTIISRAGQVLAYGRLLIHQQEDGSLRLHLETEHGRLLQGGLVSEDGDMTEAGRVLAAQFFDMWGMSDLTLSIRCGNEAESFALPPSSIETALL